MDRVPKNGFLGILDQPKNGKRLFSFFSQLFGTFGDFFQYFAAP